MPEYLFIRLLEACNAGCFMCSFALSRDPYRLSTEDLKGILSRSATEGVRFVRFTGGEPLMHRDISDLVAVAGQNGIRSSIITNGSLLAKKAHSLCNAGLDQIVVSIDGIESTHDELRGVRGLFKKCIEGLKVAGRLGIKLRVNTVVGPYNFKEVLALQEVLTSLGVTKWELSSLKLSGRLDYAPHDREFIEEQVVPVLRQRSLAGLVFPLGKIWCGETKEERDRYFDLGIPPRADNICHLVDHVRYLDAKNGKLYVCPLVPHRHESEKKFPVRIESPTDFSTSGAAIKCQAEFYRTAGPQLCTGCSSSAAAFDPASNVTAGSGDWLF